MTKIKDSFARDRGGGVYLKDLSELKIEKSELVNNDVHF